MPAEHRTVVGSPATARQPAPGTIVTESDTRIAPPLSTSPWLSRRLFCSAEKCTLMTAYFQQKYAHPVLLASFERGHIKGVKG
ncbi:hypothetical protein GCM10012289_47020 [Nonomuraea cavernae]|uniref:Uncharacterized protein n=1 Tax=Nonomuraea cavernae TaxID=2045107 RepID=A0A917Z6S5_9ACTN|nr:hypothetical protein GCM10012289_47020 [Nonomuraea cavernae]